MFIKKMIYLKTVFNLFVLYLIIYENCIVKQNLYKIFTS